MASLAEIQQIVQQIKDDLPLLINRSKIAPKQVMIVNGLSDMSERLGLVQAGEFRSGNGLEPGFGFSGVRIGYPAFVYDNELWNIVGVNADTLQVGIRASDGKLVFGGGDGFLDEFGLNFVNQEGAIFFQDLTTGSFDNVRIYIDSNDNLRLANSVANKAIILDVDDVSNNVVSFVFNANGLTLDNGKEFYVGDYALSTQWFPLAHSWTRTGNHTFTVPGDVTGTYRKGAKVTYTDGGSTEYGVVISSSYSGGTGLTTVTLLTNSDYALSAGTLADFAISYGENPLLFPHEFNFTPSGVGYTLGNGTLTGKVVVQGNQVDFHIHLKLGSTSSITGGIVLGLPVAHASYGSNTFMAIGETVIHDFATAIYNGVTVLQGGDITVRVVNASGTYAVWSTLSSTVPMTWANGDELDVKGSYTF